MPIIFLEGFDTYNTSVTATNDNSGILANWSSTYIYDKQIVSGRYGGQAFRLPSNGGVENVDRSLKTTISSFSVGFDYRLPTTFGSCRIMNMTDKQGYNSYLSIGSTGELTVNCGNTIVAQSVGGVIQSNNWYFIEWSVKIHATQGQVSIFVDGFPVAQVSNINTVVSNRTSVTTISLSEGGRINDYDNLYVSDEIVNYGPCQISTFKPNADDAGNFVPSSGTTSYNMVNESPADGDTSYITGQNVGDQQTFGIADLATNPPQIIAVQVSSTAKKTDSGTRAVGHVIKTDSNTVVGPNIALSTGYSSLQTTFNTSPSGSAWTKDDVNNLNIGVKVTV